MFLIPPLSVTQYDTVQFADGSSLIMSGSRGGAGGPDPPPPGKSQKYSFFFINTGPDPVENLKAKHVPSQHYITGQHRSASETPFKMTFR